MAVQKPGPRPGAGLGQVGEAECLSSVWEQLHLSAQLKG